jgi:hypothetical protein
VPDETYSDALEYLELVFGRVGRAVKEFAAARTILTSGILETYNPEVLAAVAAVGLGMAGAFGGGGAVTGVAVDKATAWGAREGRRLAKLPHKVLAMITDDSVVLYEWTIAGGGRQVAVWPKESFSASPVHFLGEEGARVVLKSGLMAVLTCRTGMLHRRHQHDLIAALLAMADQSHTPE